MKINSSKFKELVQESGLTVEQLAEALQPESTSKQIGLAQKKVRNWLAGRNTPVAKPGEIQALAQAVGGQAKDIATFTSTCKYTRSSQRKARLLVDLIRGRRIDEAESLLNFSTKRAAVFVKKALHAAKSDAELANADVSQLVVTEAVAQEGPTIKRFRPKDRGRAHPIMKRTSHITISVEEVA